MLLNTLMGLFYVDPQFFLPDYLHGEDGVRQRMLRLAQVAAIALSLLTLLFEALAAKVGETTTVRRARWCFWCGTLGMPVILTVAALTALEVKYLLPIPAMTMFTGAALAGWLAFQVARPLEAWGWVIIAASMGVGLMIGMYAFDGPLPAPTPLEHYNDFVRRLTRLDHAYCIVLGLTSILIAREQEEGYSSSWLFRTGRVFLVAGIVVTLTAAVVLAVADLPTSILSPGPLLVVVGAFLSVLPGLRT
jgi:hypothetical protein